MNLVIYFDESIITSIIESSIKRLLQFDDYSSGELARHVESRTREALLDTIQNTDWSRMIKSLASEYTKGIVENVVKEELKKYARIAVKELKDKGQLIQWTMQSGGIPDELVGSVPIDILPSLKEGDSSVMN